jgi:hypothetical protein
MSMNQKFFLPSDDADRTKVKKEVVPTINGLVDLFEEHKDVLSFKLVDFFATYGSYIEHTYYEMFRSPTNFGLYFRVLEPFSKRTVWIGYDYPPIEIVVPNFLFELCLEFCNNSMTVSFLRAYPYTVTHNHLIDPIFDGINPISDHYLCGMLHTCDVYIPRPIAMHTPITSIKSQELFQMILVFIDAFWSSNFSYYVYSGNEIARCMWAKKNDITLYKDQSQAELLSKCHALGLLTDPHLFDDYPRPSMDESSFQYLPPKQIREDTFPTDLHLDLETTVTSKKRFWFKK